MKVAKQSELEEDPIDIWYFHKTFDFILPEFWW